MRPGNEARHGFLDLGFADEFGGIFFGGAADFADHDDGLGLGVGQKHFQNVDEFRALDRIAANANGGGLAKAFLGGLEHCFIGKRSGARDDADGAFLENIARHDADLAFAWRENAGAIRADEASAGTRQARASPSPCPAPECLR